MGLTFIGVTIAGLVIGKVDNDNSDDQPSARSVVANSDTSLRKLERWEQAGSGTVVGEPSPSSTPVPASVQPEEALPIPTAPATADAGQPAAVYGNAGVTPNTDLERLICSYSWPCGQALRVMRCESGGNPNAISPDGENYGLYQINRVHQRHWGDFWQNWMLPERNVQWAYEIWSVRGWAPWGCRP